MVSTFEKYATGEDANGDGMSAMAHYEAQTFTIGTVGDNLTFNITSVDVKLATAVEGAYKFQAEIQEVSPDGKPTGEIISSGTISQTFPITATWYNIPMTETSLKQSKQYALIIKPTEDIDNSYWREDAAGATYTGGTTLTTTDSGASWAADTGSDKMFQINGGDYNGTLCTLSDAVNKAGAKASTSSTNESLVSDWVKQNEGYIIGRTKYNWIDVYATLNVDVKYILNSITALLTAIDIITFDISNYTARYAVESEQMVNTYRERIEDLFKVLEKPDKQTWLKNGATNP